MIYWASLMGFGDALISLALLEKVKPAGISPAVVLGTKLTSEVASTLISSPWWEQRLVLDGIPGFYDVRTQGLGRALRDFTAVSAYLRRCLRKGDVLVLEKSDWRRSMLSIGHRAEVVSPVGTSAYEGRKALVEPLFSSPIHLVPCSVPATRPKRVVVNPSARQVQRCLPHALLHRLFTFFKGRGSQVVLVDPTGRYREFANSANVYLESPSLASAAQAVREGDFYLGPDSFFLHLAYYYGKPFFTFFLRDWFYFAPPGTLDLGNYATFDLVADTDLVLSRLEAVFGRN